MKHSFWTWMGVAMMSALAAADGPPAADAEPNGYGAPRRHYRQAHWQDRLDELRARFGRNKEIPARYELPALLALSHFPQLEDAHIRFKIVHKGAPIASRPIVGTLFRAKKRRVYLVTISESERWGDHPALVRNMSFNAQIGALGHELAHTVYYEQKSFFQFIGIGASFISRRFHKRFERDTDRRAIEHGLGWQLYDWARELRGGRIEDRPDSWLDRYYLSPERIAAHIRKAARDAPDAE